MEHLFRSHARAIAFVAPQEAAKTIVLLELLQAQLYAEPSYGSHFYHDVLLMCVSFSGLAQEGFLITRYPNSL